MGNTIHTDLNGLLLALGTDIESLRKDRRYSKALGTEPITLQPLTAAGTQLHIVAAPAWLPVQDFGPIGVSWAKRAGWR